jgi:hypothetical protein
MPIKMEKLIDEMVPPLLRLSHDRQNAMPT